MYFFESYVDCIVQNRKGESSMTKDKMNILICFWNALGIFIIAVFFLYGFMIGGSASLGYRYANAIDYRRERIALSIFLRNAQ